MKTSPQVLVCHRVGWIVAQRRLEQRARGVDAALRQPAALRQVVVRLGQVGKVLDQFVQRVDSLVGALQVGEHHRALETQRRIAWFSGDRLVDTLHRQRGIAAAKQLVDLASLLRRSRCRGQRQCSGKEGAPKGNALRAFGCSRSTVAPPYLDSIVSRRARPPIGAHEPERSQHTDAPRRTLRSRSSRATVRMYARAA